MGNRAIAAPMPQHVLGQSSRPTCFLNFLERLSHSLHVYCSFLFCVVTYVIIFYSNLYCYSTTLSPACQENLALFITWHFYFPSFLLLDIFVAILVALCYNIYGLPNSPIDKVTILSLGECAHGRIIP